MPIFLPAAKALHAHHSDQFMQNVPRQHKVVTAIIKKSVCDQEISALFNWRIKREIRDLQIIQCYGVASEKNTMLP